MRLRYFLVVFLWGYFSVKSYAQYSEKIRFERYQYLIHSLRCDCDKQYLVKRKYLLPLQFQNTEISDTALALYYSNENWATKIIVNKDSLSIIREFSVTYLGKTVILPKYEYEKWEVETKSIECYTDKKQKHLLVYFSGKLEGIPFASKLVFNRKKMDTVIFLNRPPENAYQLLDGD